jgi:hypothetical protein
VTIEGFRKGAPGGVKLLRWLCASCKYAYIRFHFDPWNDVRPSVHEARLRPARFTPADVEDLVELQQWRRPARRGAGSGSNVGS